MIPNLRRDRLWRQHSSLDTSTSHRNDTDDSLYRQQTLDVNRVSSVETKESRVDPVFPVTSKRLERPPKKPADRRWFKKSLLALLSIFGLAFILWYGHEHCDGSFNLSTYVHERAAQYMASKRHFFDDAMLDNLKSELRRELETEIHKLKSIIASIPTPHCTFRDQKLENSLPDWFIQYDNDRTGMLDFAHESMGGQVVSNRCTQTFSNYSVGFSSRPSAGPKRILQTNIMPGECWPFKGSYGTAVIRLAAPIYPAAFTYEHIARSVSILKDNAPFEIDVYGWHNASSEHTFLGKFYFQWNDTKLQTFPFKELDADFQARFFEFNIRSNWGNPAHTCLYRFRVHGRL